MKFTIFELSLIYLILGAIRNAPIQQIEMILSLRKAFKPTEKESEMDKKADPLIHTTSRKIDITDEEKQYIYQAFCNPDLGLPVRDETISLNNKLKPKDEDKK